LRQLDEIEKAYQHVFAGSAYAVMVLRDLELLAGFRSTYPAGTDPQLLIDHNAVRRLFGRIYETLSLTPEGRATLAEVFTPAETKE
jgi:hypothetical protein